MQPYTPIPIFTYDMGETYPLISFTIMRIIEVSAYYFYRKGLGDPRYVYYIKINGSIYEIDIIEINDNENNNKDNYIKKLNEIKEIVKDINKKYQEFIANLPENYYNYMCDGYEDAKKDFNDKLRIHQQSEESEAKDKQV